MKYTDHNYYCSSNGDNDFSYESWEDFYEEIGEADPDYNLVFRYDLNAPEDKEGDIIVDAKTATLHVFFAHQRKGRLVHCIVENIADNDMEAVNAYLKAKFEYLHALWHPISSPETH